MIKVWINYAPRSFYPISGSRDESFYFIKNDAIYSSRVLYCEGSYCVKRENRIPRDILHAISQCGNAILICLSSLGPRFTCVLALMSFSRINGYGPVMKVDFEYIQ